MLQKHFFFTTLAFVLLINAASATDVPTPKAKPFNDRIVTGWVEYVRVPKLDSRFKAKFDTGATTTSLHAEILSVKKIPREGSTKKKSVVLFQVIDEEGNRRILERDVVRWVRIRTARDDNLSQRRPVIKMTLCVAGHEIESEVNLADRTELIYPVLIGRNILKEQKILVDSSRTFMASRLCGS
jgi:hypothetical protein